MSAHKSGLNVLIPGKEAFPKHNGNFKGGVFLVTVTITQQSSEQPRDRHYGAAAGGLFSPTQVMQHPHWHAASGKISAEDL